MGAVRQPAVAGMFYPGEPGELARAVAGYLDQAEPAPVAGSVPKALIVPHAGYIYSGPIAASAYALLAPPAGADRSGGADRALASGGLSRPGG